MLHEINIDAFVDLIVPWYCTCLRAKYSSVPSARVLAQAHHTHWDQGGGGLPLQSHLHMLCVTTRIDGELPLSKLLKASKVS